MDLREEGARFDLRGQISSLIGAWVSRRTYTEVMGTFDDHHVVWAPYRTFKDLVTSDLRYSTGNPMFSEVEEPGIGRYLHSRSPLAFSGVSSRDAEASPALGQHTESVLGAWLGLNASDLRHLTRQRVIGAARDE